MCDFVSVTSDSDCSLLYLAVHYAHIFLYPPLIVTQLFDSASPFTFLVIDPSKVTCYGQGLGLIPVRRPTSCVINAPAAQRKDIDVRVIGN